MPFIAVRENDRPVLPIEVPNDQTVICPRCRERMKVREGEEIARHFYHPPNDHGCPGESQVHMAMKSIAVQKLIEQYPDAEPKVEHRAGETGRRADVLITFAEPQHPLGKGIAVEVQYRNEQKDLLATTEDYISDDYSVLWLFEEDYAGEHPEYEDVELRDPVPVWPYAIPNPPSGEEGPPSKGCKSSQLELSQTEIAPFMDSSPAGQLSFETFSGQSTEPSSDTELPDWSLERTVNLRLSPGTGASDELYRAWFRSQVERRQEEIREKHRDAKESDEIEERTRHLDHRFWKGPGATFEMKLLAPPRASPLFLVEFVHEDKKMQMAVDDSFDEFFTEFVLSVCVELVAVSERTPDNEGSEVVWTHQSRGKFPLTVYVERTRNDWARVWLSRQDEHSESEPALVRFVPQDLEGLIDLCTEIRLHFALES